MPEIPGMSFPGCLLLVVGQPGEVAVECTDGLC